MSDFTNIKIGSATYNVKDSTARSSASSAQTLAQMANTTALNADKKATDNAISITALNNLINRRVLYIGDSYMEGAYATTESIQKRVETVTGIPYYTNYQGGAGFITKNNNKNFQVLLSEWIENNPTRLSEVTDLVIAGGINDVMFAASSITPLALYSAFAVIDSYKSRLPNLTRTYIVPMLFVNSGFTNEYLYYTDLMRKAALEFGNNVADFAFTWLRNLTDVSYSDNIHPVQKGYDLIGDYIAKMLQGHSSSQTEYVHLSQNGCSMTLFLKDCLLHGTFSYISPSGTTTASGTVLANLYAGLGATQGVSQFFTAYGQGNTYAIEIRGNQVLAANTLPTYEIAGNFTATAFS